MAANGSVEEKGCAGDPDENSEPHHNLKPTLYDHSFHPQCTESASWIKNKVNVIQSSTAPLTLCSNTGDRESTARRTLRIERTGSTESVATTTSRGDDSPREPSSPSRPATPQSTMPPRRSYECPRADSEDSGLGPSPAKSPHPASSSSCHDDEDDLEEEDEEEDEDDSLLDLSPRTDNSYDAASCSSHQQGPSPAGDSGLDTDFYCPKEDEAPSSSSSSSGFQFLIDGEPRPPWEEEVEEKRQRFLEDASSSSLVLIRSPDCASSSQSAADAQSSAGSSSGSSGTITVEDGACKWLDCERSADANTTATDLIDHIRQCHVQSQPEDGKSFVCLWVGCKVYERPSSSRSWLERHVLLHGGSKPFRCIVDGCHQRFSSEAVLQRHVNSHFPQNHRANKGGDHSNGRLLRRRRHKHRRRPQSNKSKDFFDDGIMEHVRHSLLQLSSIEGIVTGGPPAAITFHSTVIGKRIEPSGKVKVLLHYNPEDMIPDEWVSEVDIAASLQKTIPISSLPREVLNHMDKVYTSRLLPRPAKRKRK